MRVVDSNICGQGRKLSKLLPDNLFLSLPYFYLSFNRDLVVVLIYTEPNAGILCKNTCGKSQCDYGVGGSG